MWNNRMLAILIDYAGIDAINIFCVSVIETESATLGVAEGAGIEGFM